MGESTPPGVFATRSPSWYVGDAVKEDFRLKAMREAAPLEYRLHLLEYQVAHLDQLDLHLRRDHGYPRCVIDIWDKAARRWHALDTQDRALHELLDEHHHHVHAAIPHVGDHRWGKLTMHPPPSRIISGPASRDASRCGRISGR